MIGASTDTDPAFGTVRQIDAGLLNVGYVEAGPADGPAVLLLHGWPYDIHSYVEVAPLLAAAGYRVIVPYLRGYGTTRFLSDDTLRNGEQAALAVDAIALLDALGIETAIVAGFDWGARTADIVAALWPERCNGLVSVSGYLIGSQAAGRLPLPPEAELQWWYQYYFATERGRAGYDEVPARLREADLADRVAAVGLRRRHVRSQRGVVRQPGSRRDRDPQLPLAARAGRRRGASTTSSSSGSPQARSSRCPTITLEGDANGAPHPDPSAYAAKFSGAYSHRTIEGGIGHNLPQEAPEAFADAVLDVGGMHT